jgi:RNA recognition motif. (a.k.a. RRM, RBD, or RNP domain)
MQQPAAATKLLFSNVPPDCHDDYLWLWVEARGFRVFSLKLIRDQVSRTSPSFAHVQLMNTGRIDEAVRTLNGQNLRGRKVQVGHYRRLTA